MFMKLKKSGIRNCSELHPSQAYLALGQAGPAEARMGAEVASLGSGGGGGVVSPFNFW